jgi:hypothetical protein
MCTRVLESSQSTHKPLFARKVWGGEFMALPLLVALGSQVIQTPIITLAKTILQMPCQMVGVIQRVVYSPCPLAHFNHFQPIRSPACNPYQMVGVMQAARGDCDEEYGAALDECARAALRTQFPHTVNDLCNAYLAFTVAQVWTDGKSPIRNSKTVLPCGL